MLRELADGEMTVGRLAEPFAMSLAAASKHIKVLENAGLVRREVRGRTHWCSLEPEPLTAASELLSEYRHFWSRSLDRLTALIDAENRKKEKDDG
jgi:DNA-binding transcriptional ArsR family regulator